MKDYSWLNKKTPRKVDNLKLWPDNPRLNPEESHINLSDYAEDLTSENADREDFFDLVKSIVEDGFIPAGPVVVWQSNENGKFYVAEGNRRLLALKLLRKPDKAPKSIRGFIRKQSEKIDINDIEKILVNVAPSFEAAEWYINQRNNASSLQRPWSRVQQQRWITELYDKHNGDIDWIKSITKMSQAELEGYIRILKIKDYVKEQSVKDNLSVEEYEKASSYKFPVTILERFFTSSEVKEKWGIEYDGVNVIIKSNKESFLAAYTALIKRIIDKDAEIKIDTRTITSNLTNILLSLPPVVFDEPNDENANNDNSDVEVETTEVNNQQETVSSETSADVEDVQSSRAGLANDGNSTTETPAPTSAPIIPRPSIYLALKNNPNRNRVILPIYTLRTSNYRLLGLFNEFKEIPTKYKNSIAASIRIFLDLSVLQYLESENLIGDLCRAYPNSGGIKYINLSKRIEFIKPRLCTKTQGVIQKLLNPNNELSLDVLNGYVHNNDTHYLSPQFLNRFWDFLFPLFEDLLDIKERNV